MQQPECTTSEPCFWGLGPNFWRKTWPSWTDWRGDLQEGHRPPRFTGCCTILGTYQGRRAPPSPVEPKYQPPDCWIKWTWLQRRPACLRAEEEDQDCSMLSGGPSVLVSKRLVEPQKPLLGSSGRKRLVEDHYYFNMHICFRHLCLFDWFITKDYLKLFPSWHLFTDYNSLLCSAYEIIHVFTLVQWKCVEIVILRGMSVLTIFDLGEPYVQQSTLA